MCFTCVPHVLHVFTTCVTRGCPWTKFWAVQNFLPRPTPFRFFSASCHVYKSPVGRLKLDNNANNIVCFTGDNFLTGFGRDQAVKRCVTGPCYTSPMTVLCPRRTPKLSRLTASPQVLITAGTRVITCVSRVLHVCCTSLPRVPPVVVRGLKFWAVQNFLPRPTPFRFSPASCHVYKSNVARLKLDINANNIVCFTGDHFLTGFCRDKLSRKALCDGAFRNERWYIIIFIFVMFIAATKQL